MGSLGLAALMCPAFSECSQQCVSQSLLIGRLFFSLNSPGRGRLQGWCLLFRSPAFSISLLSCPLPPVLSSSFLPCRCPAMKLRCGKNIGFGVQQIWGQVQGPPLPVAVTLAALPHLCDLSFFICKGGRKEARGQMKPVVHSFSGNICSLPLTYSLFPF